MGRGGQIGRRGGMTLIELMVVIVVIGILAGMIVPAFGGSLSAMRLRGAGRDLASLMDVCYHQAVASGRVHMLLLNADGRRFAIQQEKPMELAGAGATETAGGGLLGGPSEAETRFGAGAADPEAPPEWVPVALPGFVARSLPEGIRINSIWSFDETVTKTDEGDFRLLFFPDGTAEFAEVTLLDDAGDQLVVSLNGLSGTILVGDVTPAEQDGAGAEAGDAEAAGGAS